MSLQQTQQCCGGKALLLLATVATCMAAALVFCSCMVDHCLHIFEANETVTVGRAHTPDPKAVAMMLLPQSAGQAACAVSSMPLQHLSSVQ